MIAANETMNNSARSTGSTQRASSSYASSQLSGLSPRESMAEAFRFMLTTLNSSRHDYQRNAFDQMAEKHAKIISILGVIYQTLEQRKEALDADSLPAARHMAHACHSITTRLTFILNEKEIEKVFADLGDILSQLYTVWKPEKVDPKDGAPTAVEKLA
jgi:flagellin-specific chaperone FliS